MPRPFAYSDYLILAVGRAAHSKAFGFLVLSIHGVIGYFVDRDAAESFINSQGV